MTIHSVDAETSSSVPSQPLVSVLMSVYNGERYLRDSIDSVLAQTYEHLEIVIVDDGSTDGTASILATYVDPRIVVVHRAENIGLTRSLNEGLRNTKGKYVARLDVGDIAVSGRIAAQVRELEQHPDVGIIGSDIVFFCDDTKLREYRHVTDHDRIVEQLRTFASPLPHSTLLMRRSILDALCGYDERFERSQDRDLLLRASRITRLASFGEVLVYLRFDPTSLSYASSAQLVYGTAARVRAYRWDHGYRDELSNEAWAALLQHITSFIAEHFLDAKTDSAKYRILAEVAFRQRHWVQFGHRLLRLLVRHPLFFIENRTKVSEIILDRIPDFSLERIS
ncbi:MAG: glycosyltransferase [Candidatus Uhrbacteria bacterium]